MSNFLLSSSSHWIEQDFYSKEDLSPKDLAVVFKDYTKELEKYLAKTLPGGTQYKLHIHVFTHELFAQLHHLRAGLEITEFNGDAATGSFVVPRPPTPPVPIGTKNLFPLNGGYFEAITFPVRNMKA